MPSFTTYLTSLAVTFFTVAQLTAARSSHGLPPLASRQVSLDTTILFERDLVATADSVQKHQSASARLRLARTRAARKAKRDAALDNQRRTTAFGGSMTTSAFGTYLKTKCSRNSNCAYAKNQADLPTDGTPVCSARYCAISCRANYILQNDGSCLAGSTGCPKISHGAYFLVEGACAPTCAGGYTLTGTSTSDWRCTNFNTNVNHCGASDVVCAPSYNNVGARSCSNGVCGLSCSGGTFQYSTSSGQLYCA